MPKQLGAGGHKSLRAIIALVKRTTFRMFQMIYPSFPRRADAAWSRRFAVRQRGMLGVSTRLSAISRMKRRLLRVRERGSLEWFRRDHRTRATETRSATLPCVPAMHK
ncbi:hypothetical protein DPMN_003694 [Dreissena polymorpha]|uniref:Uncharacterized protein n=1 Tax=Dreissena polymorpha TaxID=45954 RepID=A0A9D4MNS7_DREPO|nr:hypothetical protein DPMN_003694 [Dreissena polymorpha]